VHLKLPDIADAAGLMAAGVKFLGPTRRKLLATVAVPHFAAERATGIGPGAAAWHGIERHALRGGAPRRA
jgi:hypothetical protein